MIAERIGSSRVSLPHDFPIAGWSELRRKSLAPGRNGSSSFPPILVLFLGLSRHRFAPFQGDLPMRSASLRSANTHLATGAGRPGRAGGRFP